jgi:hypothetical protein
MMTSPLRHGCRFKSRHPYGAGDGGTLVLERAPVTMAEAASIPPPSQGGAYLAGEVTDLFRRRFALASPSVLERTSPTLATGKLSCLFELHPDRAVLAVLPEEEVKEAEDLRHSYGTVYPNLFGPSDRPVVYRIGSGFRVATGRFNRSGSFSLAGRNIWMRGGVGRQCLIEAGSLFSVQAGATAILEYLPVVILGGNISPVPLPYTVHLAFVIGLEAEPGTAGPLASPFAIVSEFEDLMLSFLVWKGRDRFQPSPLFSESGSEGAETPV